MIPSVHALHDRWRSLSFTRKLGAIVSGDRYHVRGIPLAAIMASVALAALWARFAPTHQTQE